MPEVYVGLNTLITLNKRPEPLALLDEEVLG